MLWYTWTSGSKANTWTVSVAWLSMAVLKILIALYPGCSFVPFLDMRLGLTCMVFSYWSWVQTGHYLLRMWHSSPRCPFDIHIASSPGSFPLSTMRKSLGMRLTSRCITMHMTKALILLKLVPWYWSIWASSIMHDLNLHVVVSFDPGLLTPAFVSCFL